jgi:hypothetical protein
VDDLFKKGKEKESAKEAAIAVKKVSPAKGKEKKAQNDMEIDEDEYDAMLADDDDIMAELDGKDRVDLTPRNVSDMSCNTDLDTAPSKKPSSKSSTSKIAGDAKKSSESTKPAKKDKVLKSGNRKTRRVTKKVVTTNAKGFKVTKEVETDESYSGSEDEDDGPTVASSSKPAEKESKPAKKEKEKESTPSSASGTAAKKKASAGKPGEQASLKNFFGKPKAASKK